jgi:DNA polymerase
LAEQGCTVDSLDRDVVAELLLRDDLSAPVRRVLELRQSGASAAAKKITALLAQCCDDGRIRGAFQYHRASTGRWSGSGPQPQNLKRPEVEDIEAAIAAVSTGSYAHVRSFYSKPLAVIGDLSRSMVRAAPGKKFIGGDLNSVESRTLAWVADENWKLDSYRRFDATHDPRDEPYCVTACKIFRVPDGSFTAESPERKVGKTCDLAFGYQGGLNAWRIFEPDRFTDQEVQQFKADWRRAHPNIKKFWYDIDVATWKAVRNRERVIRCSRLLLKCTGSYLYIKLPSGRKLAYPYPRIEIEDLQHEVVVFKDASAGQWRDCRHGDGGYGGLWTENIVSGIARDLLAAAMLRLEAAGYKIVLHVHDECVAEVPEDFGSVEEFVRLMVASPAWALGLPIAAKGWTGQRFNKA